MSGIDAFLFRCLLRDMSDQLMAREAQRDSVGRFTPERAPKTIYIEPLGLSEVMDGECSA